MDLLALLVLNTWHDKPYDNREVDPRKLSAVLPLNASVLPIYKKSQNFPVRFVGCDTDS